MDYTIVMCVAIGVLLGWGAKMQFSLGWWIVPVFALLAGSLAWVMCDFAGVLAGVKKAWQEVAGWKPDRARVVRFFKLWFYWSMSFVGGIFWFTLFLIFLMSTSAQEKSDPLNPANLVVLALVLTSISAGLSLIVAFGMSKEIGPPEKPVSPAVMEFGRGFALYCNLISLPFVIIYFLAKGLIWVVAKIPGTAVAFVSDVCRLVVISFVLIHSEERRICFTATGLGTAIGLITCYQHGNAFFGAVIGSAVGGILGRLECRWGKRWAEHLATRWLKKEITPA
ncbi:MAG: hypothetical protein V1704_00360 [Candidatus Vogelbacteria bacterium]